MLLALVQIDDRPRSPAFTLTESERFGVLEPVLGAPQFFYQAAVHEAYLKPLYLWADVLGIRRREVPPGSSRPPRGRFNCDWRLPKHLLRGGRGISHPVA